jgi:hypothetical protein
VAVSAQAGFGDGATTLNLDVAWIHGSQAAKYNTDPDIQVHACDEHTYILRQNMAVHYEAPFMFLLFGGSRALLLDTGATANPQFFPLRRTVDSIIDRWLASHPHPDGYELLVLHTHSHTDHTAADRQFTGRPRRQEFPGRVDKLLGPSLLNPEQDRPDNLAGNPALAKRVVDPLTHMRFAARDGIVNRILEADACVAVPGAMIAREHEQLYVVVATRLSNDITLQRIEDALQDWPHHCGDRRHLVGHRAKLLLAPNLHGLNSSRVGALVASGTGTRAVRDSRAAHGWPTSNMLWVPTARPRGRATRPALS